MVSDEVKRLVSEAIAKLVNIKTLMAERLLLPTGIPTAVYAPVIKQKDPITGLRLTKRQMAPIILDRIDALPNSDDIYFNLLVLIANWKDFHLANAEYEARAVVSKAVQMLGAEQVRRREVAEQLREEQKEKAALEAKRQHAEQQKELSLLLMMFGEMDKESDQQARGYQLEQLLDRLMRVFDIPVYEPFRRNAGAEQIDGAFRFRDSYFLVECRWRKKKADTGELDAFKGKIQRSSKLTMGMFLSIEGWSDNVPPLLKQSPSRDAVLMDGYDLRAVLTADIGFPELLDAKIAHLSLSGEPFLSARLLLAHAGG